jgi:uracil-DNA glycosylase
MCACVSVPTLASRKAEILAGVDAGWAPCLDSETLDSALADIDALGDAGCLAPPPELVFEALRYGGPDDVRVVIVGQDPYSDGSAHGLCFSAPQGRGVPKSLARVFQCLGRSGLRREDDIEGGRAACGDLRPWAVQGVLLLNSALTTRQGASRAHAREWAPFVRELVRRLCAVRAGTPLHFLLWGQDARAHARAAREHGHTVHEWTHPSPVADNQVTPEARFRMCPHFEDVNAALLTAGRRSIAWDNRADCVAFADGACTRNGKPGARAAFAVLLVGGQFGAAIVRGEVRSCEYAFRDPAAPERGVVPTSRAATPSNNRGELMGLVYCLLGLLVGRALGRVEIWTDSQISAKTLLEWLPARLHKGTERELKNFDLVWIAWTLLGKLRLQAEQVEIVHIKSHQMAPPETATARDRLAWKGNQLADQHAAKVLAEATTDTAVVAIGGPPVLHRIV